MKRGRKDAGDAVAEAMEICNGDRDSAIQYLIKADNDFDLNEAFRVLGIMQAVRSYTTQARHGYTPDAHRERVVPGPVNGSVRRVKIEQHREQVQTAKVAIKDTLTKFMEMHKLFGGRVSLARATRGDFQNSIESYDAQEAGARRMKLFHTDCRDELPKGSLTATLKPTQYPTIFKHAQNRGIV